MVLNLFSGFGVILPPTTLQVTLQGKLHFFPPTLREALNSNCLSLDHSSVGYVGLEKLSTFYELLGLHVLKAANIVVIPIIVRIV